MPISLAFAKRSAPSSGSATACSTGVMLAAGSSRIGVAILLGTSTRRAACFVSEAQALRSALGRQTSASAPPTTSRISCVISAWRARFMLSVSVSISSPAFFEALRIAVMRAPCSEAVDSSSAR